MVNEERLPGLHILASHRDPHALALHRADEAFIEPEFDYASDAGIRHYRNWCLDVCRRHRVDVFAAQAKQRILAPFAGQFDAIGTRLLVNADADMLDAINDKTRFYRLARAADLPMPMTTEVRDLTGFDVALAELAEAGLRACIKPPRGIFGSGYWQLEDTITAFEALMHPDDRRMPTQVVRAAIEQAFQERLTESATTSDTGTEPAPRLLVLEFLQGPEWSIDCLCEDGRLLAAVARLKLDRAQRLVVKGPAIDLARRTVAACSLSGLINVQLRAAGVEEDEGLRVLEVNTRMSGGCLYTRASGVNLPWWHIALSCGLRSPDQIPLPVGGALVASTTEAVEITRSLSSISS